MAIKVNIIRYETAVCATCETKPLVKSVRCHSDMGIRAFLASLIPKTLVIWTSPSHITLAIWVRVRLRVTRDVHITDHFTCLGNCRPTPPLNQCWPRGWVGGQFPRNGKWSHITRVLGMGLPKTRGCPHHCDTGSQRRNPCSGPPPMYQDLNRRHNWPVKKAVVDLPIRLKENSKGTSSKSLSPFGPRPRFMKGQLARIQD